MGAALRRSAVIATTVAVFLSGCAISGLSFVTDDRIKIAQPEQNAEISLPAEIVWTAEDYDGAFAVFFDRSPMRPNQDLESLVSDPASCLDPANCPDAEWLAERNIYVTAETRLVLDQLPDRRSTRHQKDRHDLTIVLLDEAGKRVSESVFTREFVVERAE